MCACRVSDGPSGSGADSQTWLTGVSAAPSPLPLPADAGLSVPWAARGAAVLRADVSSAGALSGGGAASREMAPLP